MLVNITGEDMPFKRKKKKKQKMKKTPQYEAFIPFYKLLNEYIAEEILQFYKE
jgi:hypothetical protein